MDPNAIAVIPALEAQEDTNAENTMQPTARNQSSRESMVTVRLSDSEPSTSNEPPAHKGLAEEEVLEDFPTMENEESFVANESLDGVYDHQKPMLAEEAKVAQRIHRDSVAAMDRDSIATMSSTVEEGSSDTASSTVRSRSDSSGTFSSLGSAHVDWDELDKSEEQAPRDEGSDESTAFLLARLEQENNALAHDPKANLSKTSRNRTKSRPPSIQHLKKLVNEPTKPSLRYSMVQNPPQMTELDFWAALVVDYSQTAQRLPTLTSNKIRSGVPPPLRGVVWMSIAGARASLLEDEYDRLCNEKSPYEGLIGKDIGRSFPNVDMFRDPAGEGQQMLARVLKCFSLYDEKIGYCQGLGFVVGPLLMHMGDKEAFCVLVRLMEHYDLRSCFLPDLSGLHLRIFQFQQLLSRHLPRVTAHLDTLQIEPLYVSQWFLSFFAVTCPLPMLLRIYDVILTEGASETLMRVALSLMRRNKDKILKCTEIEDVMQLLLSRELWDTYGCNADDLVNDFVGLTGLVTRESLESLEQTYKQSPMEGSESKAEVLPGVQAAASRFLGRFWSGSAANTKIISPGLNSPGANLSVSAQSRPSSFLRRTPSKQSMASTLNSIESSETHASATSTEATEMSRSPSGYGLSKSTSSARDSEPQNATARNRDKDLHTQIEDLLTALSDMQREQAVLVNELQKEREDREEDRAMVRHFVEQSKQAQDAQRGLEAIPEHQEQASSENPESPVECWYTPLRELAEHFEVAKERRSSISQTKQELQEDINLWKYQYEVETIKSAELLRQLTDQEAENTRLIEQFRESRTRMQEAVQERQRMELTIQDLRARRTSMPETPVGVSTSVDPPEGRTSAPSGLREFKLGKANTLRSPQPSSTFAKRTSSLNMQAVLATEDHKPAAEEALLLELVQSKTSEAVARQELEEVKGKLDSLRKILGVNTGATTSSGHRPSPSEPCVAKNPSLTSFASSRAPAEKVTPPSSSSTGGGFFSGWRRQPSNPVLPPTTGQGAS